MTGIVVRPPGTRSSYSETVSQHHRLRPVLGMLSDACFGYKLWTRLAEFELGQLCVADAQITAASIRSQSQV